MFIEIFIQKIYICVYDQVILISILPKNHAGTVEKLISEFSECQKKLAQ